MAAAVGQLTPDANLLASPLIDPNAPALAERIRRIEPTVILTIGQKSVQVAHDAVPGIPTAFCMVLTTGRGRAR